MPDFSNHQNYETEYFTTQVLHFSSSNWSCTSFQPVELCSSNATKLLPRTSYCRALSFLKLCASQPIKSSCTKKLVSLWSMIQVNCQSLLASWQFGQSPKQSCPLKCPVLWVDNTLSEFIALMKERQHFCRQEAAILIVKLINIQVHNFGP